MLDGVCRRLNSASVCRAAVDNNAVGAGVAKQEQAAIDLACSSLANRKPVVAAAAVEEGWAGDRIHVELIPLIAAIGFQTAGVEAVVESQRARSIGREADCDLVELIKEDHWLLARHIDGVESFGIRNRLIG